MPRSIAFLRERDLEPELAQDGIQHRFTRKTDNGEFKVDAQALECCSPYAYVNEQITAGCGPHI